MLGTFALERFLHLRRSRPLPVNLERARFSMSANRCSARRVRSPSFSRSVANSSRAHLLILCQQLAGVL
jgi:hypothetical protein